MGPSNNKEIHCVFLFEEFSFLVTHSITDLEVVVKTEDFKEGPNSYDSITVLLCLRLIYLLGKDGE